MLSRQMMDGQKWRCFVMDVTIYLPWSLLPALVLGAAGFALTAVTGQEAFRFLYSGMVVSLLDMFLSTAISLVCIPSSIQSCGRRSWIRTPHGTKFL